MSGSALLEVIVALAFIYILLSLVCSAVNELISQALGQRGKFFQQALKRLLPDSKLQRLFYRHPLIKSLGRYDENDLEKDKRTAPTNIPGLPSYVPRGTFALVVLDIVTRGLPDEGEAAAEEPAPNRPLSIGELRERVATFPNEHLRDALLPLIDAAEDNLDEARENVAQWFDNTMDRVSGWYKRSAQRILLVISALVVLAVNADTLAIAQRMWKDPAVRQAVATQALAYAKEEQKAEKKQEDGATSWSTHLKEMDDHGLPIGWSDETVPARDDWLAWLQKVAGLFISFIAVAQGAPFWFELLNKIVSMRASGRVPPRARKSKDS